MKWFLEQISDLPLACGHKLPSFSRLFHRSWNYSYSTFNSASPSALVLANPFTVTPLILSISVLVGAFILPTYVPILLLGLVSDRLFLLRLFSRPQQESYDLLLALLGAALTFKIAYPAAEVQGTVLLQTSPPRGLPGGRMEAFLRVMREVRSCP